MKVRGEGAEGSTTQAASGISRRFETFAKFCFPFRIYLCTCSWRRDHTSARRRLLTASARRCGRIEAGQKRTPEGEECRRIAALCDSLDMGPCSCPSAAITTFYFQLKRCLRSPIRGISPAQQHSSSTGRKTMLCSSTTQMTTWSPKARSTPLVTNSTRSWRRQLLRPRKCHRQGITRV